MCFICALHINFSKPYMLTTQIFLSHCHYTFDDFTIMPLPLKPPHWYSLLCCVYLCVSFCHLVCFFLICSYCSTQE